MLEMLKQEANVIEDNLGYVVSSGQTELHSNILSVNKRTSK